MPRIVNWSDPEFRRFQYLREQWMAEFCSLSTKAIKAIQPDVTIEHNMAVSSAPWRFGTSDLIGEQCDYIGGDLYGGLLEQTFICKYFRNLSKALPFVYITSRCDPDLKSHTTTKTSEAFLLQAMISLVHNGALSICDGANPDGTLSDEVYAKKGPIESAWSISQKYEKYVGGTLDTNVSVWFPSHSKYDFAENGELVCFDEDNTQQSKKFIQDKLNICDILRTENIPFDVLPSKSLTTVPNNLLIISEVVNILDAEMKMIEDFVNNGGNVYLSGFIGHPRLMELLDATCLGETDHDVTYMTYTDDGKLLFNGFTEQNPMAVQGKQQLIKLTGNAKVLANITLPYTLTGKREFSSIHSNPPGIRTVWPAMILKRLEKGSIFYSAAPIERSKPLMSRRVFARVIRSLMGTPKFSSNAPGYVEILSWEKEGQLFFAALNVRFSPQIHQQSWWNRKALAIRNLLC